MPGADLTSARVVYERVDSIDLAATVVRGPAGPDPAPAVAFLFGGGWAYGGPDQFLPQCRYFATRGMVAFAPDYRVMGRHGTTPFEAVADTRAFMRWLRSQARGLGIDPARIALGGGSAGGHLALCAALGLGPEGPDEDRSAGCAPDALVLFNPIVDLRAIDIAPMLDELYGERLVAIDPARHPRAGLPPTLIMHGAADVNAPIAAVRRFRDALVGLGNRCELLEHPDQGHGFFNHRRSLEAFVATTRQADAFLGSLGWLHGAPTLDLADAAALGAPAGEDPSPAPP